MIRTFRPDVVLTLGPDGAYGHPDHVAVSVAATEASILAGSAAHYADQLSSGVPPHPPARLYHTHFPRSRILLTDRLAQWLTTLKERFRGTIEFVQALSLFAQESSRLRYASDYIDVSWFPPGFYIVEQGEPGSSLYLVLSGEAEVVHEQADGTRRSLARIGPGADRGFDQPCAAGRRRLSPDNRHRRLRTRRSEDRGTRRTSDPVSDQSGHVSASNPPGDVQPGVLCAYLPADGTGN